MVRERTSGGRGAVLAGLTAGTLAGCGRAAGAGLGDMPPLPRTVPLPCHGWVRDGAHRRSAVAPARGVSPQRAGASRAEVGARYGERRPHDRGFGGPGVVRDLHSTGGWSRCLRLRRAGRQRDTTRPDPIPAAVGGAATLFLDSRWIDENPAGFRRLRGEPRFELDNHGTRHLGLSVTAVGLRHRWHRDAGEVYDEVATNEVKLTPLLGAPRLLPVRHRLRRRNGADRHGHERSPGHQLG